MPGEAEWGKSRIMEERLRMEDRLFEHGGVPYYGWPIIHRDSSIDGHVCMGEGNREAIVVNSNSPIIRGLYERALQQASVDGTVMRNKVLRAVYDTVEEALPIQNNDAVEKLINKYGAWKDVPIGLDVFIEEGVGVCRQDALACGVLLEMAKKDGHIRGTPRINRNSTWKGGHAWCRYDSYSGVAMILDVAQGYFGRLEHADPSINWPYKRPDDF